MFKPMLACSEKADAVVKKLRFPILASPKYDGIRGFVKDGVVYSRNLLPLPNKKLQKAFSVYDGYDGEFIVGDPTSPSCYRDTMSAVSTVHGDIDNLYFHVFDYISASLDMPYGGRMAFVSDDKFVSIVPQNRMHTMQELEDYEAEMLSLGHEGVILRDPHAPYKCGRSTLNEGYLLKLKRFADSEAVVVGYEERMHNANEKTLMKAGKAARSSHTAGKEATGTLGALVVQWQGIRFNIGTGFTDEERARIWAIRDSHIGTIVKFKYFPIGMLDAPRHPVYLGERMKEDV